MDIKDLNKSQLIMLALLLSFVTSIATGIVTVTLMQQAPSSIITPINKIVRETVEKIVQVPGNNTVQTVIIKEEDLIVEAISQNTSSIFTIYRDGLNEAGEPIEISAGRGFALSNDGIIVVDSSLVADTHTIYAKNESGKFKTTFVSSNKAGFSFIKLGVAVDGKSELKYTVPTFGDINNMKIGQKLLIIGSNVNSILFDGNKDIKLTVNRSNAGSEVIDLEGNVIGMALYSEAVSFVSINTILEELNQKSSDSKDPAKTL